MLTPYKFSGTIHGSGRWNIYFFRRGQESINRIRYAGYEHKGVYITQSDIVWEFGVLFVSLLIPLWC